MLNHALPCYAMLHYVLVCYVMLCFSITCPCVRVVLYSGLVCCVLCGPYGVALGCDAMCHTVCHDGVRLSRDVACHILRCCDFEL